MTYNPLQLGLRTLRASLQTQWLIATRYRVNLVYVRHGKVFNQENDDRWWCSGFSHCCQNDEHQISAMRECRYRVGFNEIINYTPQNGNQNKTANQKILEMTCVLKSGKLSTCRTCNGLESSWKSNNGDFIHRDQMQPTRSLRKTQEHVMEMRDNVGNFLLKYIYCRENWKCFTMFLPVLFPMFFGQRRC